MTTPVPTPAPTPVPEPDEPTGWLGRIRSWFEKDVEPRIATTEAGIATVQALAPQLSLIADTVVALAKAADPGAAPEIAALVDGAEKAASVIKTIVADLAASGM
jgi:hypothetical protein